MKKDLYPVGTSAAGYLADDHIEMTPNQVRGAWLEGRENGTHFTATSARRGQRRRLDLDGLGQSLQL